MPLCPCCHNHVVIMGRCTVCGPVRDGQAADCVRAPHCEATVIAGATARRCDMRSEHGTRHYTEGLGTWAENTTLAVKG